MNVSENSSYNLSAGLKRFKSTIKGKILITKAVTLSGIYETARFKLKNAKGFRIIPTYFSNEYILHKTGLEIGGPSVVFSSKGIIPLYDIAESLDNINYSSMTIWDNQWLDPLIGDHQLKSKIVTFRKEIISEASDLSNIESNSYDFIASSNVIEHLTNPLRSLLEMKRCVRPGGLVIVIVPHKDITFDHRRQVTSIDLLIKIFKLNPSEGDISHLNLDKIFQDYDLDLDIPAGELDSFKKRTFDNKQYRALHQTVFNTQLLLEMVNWAGMKIFFVKTSLLIGHILVISTKSNDSIDEIHKSNLNFLKPNADWRNKTIFRSERIRRI